MLNFFPVALILLFIIFQFTLTAGFNTASAGAAGGGEGGRGGGGEEGITSSVLLLPLPDNNVMDPKEASFFLKR